ncbi:MAG: hypothetical protein AAFU79_24360 [Myxococcota bacterium]
MPDDSPKRSPKVAPGAQVETTVRLEAEEERVLRALHGSTVPGDFPLPQKDDGLPMEVKSQLRSLEERAFERAGRLAELERELELAEAEEEQRESDREKIVARLRAPSSTEGDS